MENQPLFSIAIPTFNRLTFLMRALESALLQTYQHLEIIVLDNASTDGTKEYLAQISAQHPQIRVVTNLENIGFARNLQQIRLYVKGKYLNILSDDDYLHSKFVQSAITALEDNLQGTLWYCRAAYVDKKEQVLFTAKIGPTIEKGKQFVEEWLKGKRMPILVSAVYRVTTLHQIGWFATEAALRNAIDMTLILPCAWQGTVLYDKEILCFYTTDDHNLTHTTKVIDWFEMNLALYRYISRILAVNKKYWSCFFIRFLFFHINGLNKKIFCLVYNQALKIDLFSTFVYTAYYLPHLFIRKALGRGKLFKSMRRFIYSAKNVFK